MKRSTKLFYIVLTLALAFAALPASSALAAANPVVSNVVVTPNSVPFNTAVTLTATITDSASSNIVSAAYFLNGSLTPVAMSAKDGVFDTTTEDVTAIFTSTQFGANTVCVTGTDAASSTSEPVCANFTVQDTVGPLASNVVITPNPVPLNTMATLTATVDETTTGGALIKSAEYSLNGGAFTAMAAVTPPFDAVMENVTASFKVTKVGLNTVCVRGTDALNNIGVPVCLDFRAVYIFKGFFPPVRMDVVNKANAPQAIPLKWQLLDGNNKPIASKASFVGVESYPVDCKTLVGDPTTAVLEKSPGKSGLIYSNKGNWHFNWKTIKAYRHSCRAMFVLFNSGQTSPTVVFSFK
jgi:hypothetical protein